jgi:hypothetical protein
VRLRAVLKSTDPKIWIVVEGTLIVYLKLFIYLTYLRTILRRDSLVIGLIRNEFCCHEWRFRFVIKISRRELKFQNCYDTKQVVGTSSSSRPSENCSLSDGF